MPGMDGMTLLRRVKAQQTTRYLPFIMLTTEDSEQIKREGFEAGAGSGSQAVRTAQAAGRCLQGGAAMSLAIDTGRRR